jgi:hypothetical protein
LTGNSGVDQAECLTLGASNVTDIIPVTVESVIITELDSNLDVLKTTPATGSFMSGDIIFYESFAVSNTTVVSNGTIPRVLSISVNGINAAGEAITNSNIIFYTNECNVYPVLSPGSTIGFITVVRN